MNIFGLDTEQLELAEAREALSGCSIEKLPSVPPFLSKKECAVILGVSAKVINSLIESGQLPLTSIPNDSLPMTLDLFGLPTDPPQETCILRSDITALLEKLLVCNKTLLK